MSMKTPLYDSHVELGGRIVEFAGYLMPVSFEGIVAEHERVRGKVGLFDVSHMGEIELTGSDALKFADYAVTNNVGRMKDGQICYTVCCNTEGRVLDDLLVYRFSPERILFVANAVNAAKIHEHLLRIRKGDVEIVNLSPHIGQIAVQGPASRELLLGSAIFAPLGGRLKEMPYYTFLTFEHDGEEIILSRTGYTGELGFEIYLPAVMTTEVWRRLLADGKSLGAAPIGLGARDTLRFEPCYCLYGHEIDEETSPLEAGLSWVVKLKKDDFLGRAALLAEREAGPARRLVGLELTERGIPRQGCPVYYKDEMAGCVTSGTFSPTLQRSLAMALVKSDVPADAADLAIGIRGKSVPAVVAEMPFYKGSVND